MKQWIETEGARLLGVPTLETRGHDRLDFYHLHVAKLRTVLEAAYAAGIVADRRAQRSIAGRAKSARKAAAARANGKLGGHRAGVPHRCAKCGAGYSSRVHAATCK